MSGEKLPSHWQDPERPDLLVEHAWLYPSKAGNATSDYRMVYCVPGFVKRGKFTPFGQEDADRIKEKFNPDWAF